MNLSISSFEKGFFRYFWLSVAVCFVGFFGASELLIRYLVEPQDILDAHVRYVKNQKSPYILLGDSLSMYAFQGHEEWAKLYFESENPIHLDVKFRLYRDRVRVEKVIIGLSISYLERYDPRVEEVEKKYEMLFKDEGVSGLRVFQTRHWNFLKPYWRAFLERGTLESNRRLDSNSGEVAFRAEIDESLWEDRNKASLAAKSAKYWLSDADVVQSRQLKTLTQFVLRLVRANVDLCLVVPPLSPEFLREANKYTAFHDLNEYWLDLADKANSKFFDFNKHPLIVGTEFLDPIHVMPTGSSKLFEKALKGCEF